MIKLLFIRYSLILFAVLFTISCQEERSEFINPNDDNTIPQTSLLSKLMKNVVLHDGSYDDLVDGGNCYSILLPYTVLINGEQTIIDHVQDYDLLQTSDTIEIQFPIVVTMHNYIQQTIRDQFSLVQLSANCDSVDDDIECIDFVYPIVFSTYNSNTNTFDSLEVLHDVEVFSFMEGLDEFTVVSMDYPIDLLSNNGDILTATHNSELQLDILNHVDSCDEND